LLSSRLQRQLPTRPSRISQSADQGPDIDLGADVINKYGKHVYPLRDLCDEISRKEDLQNVRILKCESYSEGLLPPHVYLVLPLCYRGRRGRNTGINGTIEVPDTWLRLDRRTAKGSIWRFLFSSSRTVANDEVCLMSADMDLKVD
jgi:hypothetical protein